MFDLFKILLDSRLAKMEERGASAVEYGLLVAAIAGVIGLVVFALGDNIMAGFSSSCQAVQDGAGAAGQSCS